MAWRFVQAAGTARSEFVFRYASRKFYTDYFYIRRYGHKASFIRHRFPFFPYLICSFRTPPNEKVLPPLSISLFPLVSVSFSRHMISLYLLTCGPTTGWTPRVSRYRIPSTAALTTSATFLVSMAFFYLWFYIYRSAS